MCPSHAPDLLRTILLGTLTLSIEQRAHDIQNLLGAVRSEMGKMDQVLAKLAGHTEKMSKSVEDARRRTRAVDRKLRTVTVLETAQADAVLELEAAETDED
jgi:DNA recombination protein RmuC